VVAFLISKPPLQVLQFLKARAFALFDWILLQNLSLIEVLGGDD
jgi:hypothetical protein